MYKLMDGTYKDSMVVSLAGRDKSIVYLVLHEDLEYLYVADGKKHSVVSPKKKKRKHVRLITGDDGKPIRFDGQTLTNRFVRAWLRENVGRVQR